MGTASELRGIATWKAVTSKRFNSTAFKAEHPDIYQKYLSTLISRVFRLEK
jgi:predicted phage-related endonuclease